MLKLLGWTINRVQTSTISLMYEFVMIVVFSSIYQKICEVSNKIV